MAFFGDSFFSLFLVFLSLCFVSTSSTLAPHSEGPQIAVYIRNELPLPNDFLDVEPLRLACDQGSWVDLNLGELYERTLALGRDYFNCSAWWSRWFAAWNAYKAKTDQGHSTIYWKAEEDGFYHSWDGYHWNLLAYWHFMD